MEDFVDLIKIDEKASRQKAKNLLEAYRTVKRQLMQFDSLVATRLSDMPRSPNHANHADHLIVKKIEAEKRIADIEQGVRDMKYANFDMVYELPSPTDATYRPIQYYKRLLTLKYLDMTNVHKSKDVPTRKKLVKEFRDYRSILDVANEGLVDKWLYYKDLQRALNAFVLAYKDGELIELDFSIPETDSC